MRWKLDKTMPFRRAPRSSDLKCTWWREHLHTAGTIRNSGIQPELRQGIRDCSMLYYVVKRYYSVLCTAQWWEEKAFATSVARTQYGCRSGLKQDKEALWDAKTCEGVNESQIYRTANNWSRRTNVILLPNMILRLPNSKPRMKETAPRKIFIKERRRWLCLLETL